MVAYRRNILLVYEDPITLVMHDQKNIKKNMKDISKQIEDKRKNQMRCQCYDKALEFGHMCKHKEHNKNFKEKSVNKKLRRYSAKLLESSENGTKILE